VVFVEFTMKNMFYVLNFGVKAIMFNNLSIFHKQDLIKYQKKAKEFFLRGRAGLTGLCA